MTSNLKSVCDPTSKIVDFIVYMKNIGSLMYLTNMRPNIFFSVLICVHMTVIEHEVWYPKGIIEYGLIYVRDQRIFLHEYNDFD